MPTLQEKIDLLPPEVKQEVFDFVDFMFEKYIKEEKQYWTEANQRSIDKIWSNIEDDIYNELL
jgi:hypothetical protein